MPTLEEIQKQIANKGLNSFMTGKEIKQLPGILWENESVEDIVQGAYNNGHGILVATQKRLIFVDKGLFSLKVEDFGYDKISSIQYESGILNGKITIFASGNKAIIEYVPKKEGKLFSENLRAKISNLSQKPAAPVAQAPDNDVFAKLEKLGKLKESGVLSQAEFDSEKAKLLAQ